MLMTKGLDSKILYTLLLVSGFVLTIGAASAVVMYTENIELDNGTGDSSIKVTSSTGDSKVIVEDQGGRAFSVTTVNGLPKFQITDETMGKPRITINKFGQVGIATIYPQAKLDVSGTMKVRHDADFDKNLNVDGIITGSYIANLEATIAALEVRIASLEASLAINEPMIVTNEAMIASHDTTLTAHDAMILTNQADIATNAQAIEEGGGGGGPNPCDPDGDAVITAAEMSAYMISHGINWTEANVQSKINQAEIIVASPQSNGVLDTLAETTQFNVAILIPFNIPVCDYP